MSLPFSGDLNAKLVHYSNGQKSSGWQIGFVMAQIPPPSKKSEPWF